MKKFLARLRKDERGNVLYMTIILMMLLSMFSLAMTNIVYIGVMKIRAQNAADNIALSAATLKARVLNSYTNFNGILWVGSMQGGRIGEEQGYTNYVDLGLAIGSVTAASINYFAQLYAFHDQITSKKWIDRIAESHGIKGNAGRYEMFPVNIAHMLTSSFFKLQPTTFLTYPIVTLDSIQPNHTWYVQSRVEMRTKDYIVGGKHLGFELPDITARARAEVLSKSLASALGSTGKYWKASLAPIDESVDRYMMEQTGSRNSGDYTDREIAPSTSATPVPTPDISIYQSEEAFIDQLPLNAQYEFYREKVSKKKATTSEKIKYYNLKEKLGRRLTLGEKWDRARCYGIQRRENKLK